MSHTHTRTQHGNGGTIEKGKGKKLAGAGKHEAREEEQERADSQEDPQAPTLQPKRLAFTLKKHLSFYSCLFIFPLTCGV